MKTKECLPKVQTQTYCVLRKRARKKPELIQEFYMKKRLSAKKVQKFVNPLFPYKKLRQQQYSQPQMTNLSFQDT